MHTPRRHPVGRLWPFLFCVLAAGCGAEDDFGRMDLIRVGRQVVTVQDFDKAFELVEPAYDTDLYENPSELQEARVRLLNEMTEEMLILERAEELAIAVSDEELQAGIDAIKADYPSGSFDEVLLEAAVPYDVWKQRLKVRLLLEKVIAAELQDQMAVTPGDVRTYYERQMKIAGSGDAAEARLPSEPVDHEAIVRDLRRQKAEAAYGKWIEGLKAKYPVEINAAVWNKLSNTKRAADTAES